MHSSSPCAKPMTRNRMNKLTMITDIVTKLTNNEVMRGINESNSIIASLASVFSIAAKKLGVIAVANEFRTDVIASDKMNYNVAAYDIQFDNGRKIQLFFDRQSYATHPNRVMIRIYDVHREKLPYLVPMIEYEPDQGRFFYHPDIDFDQLALLAHNEKAIKNVKWVEPFTLEICKNFITAGIV